MKKIGMLFGKERSFPEAFVARVNSKNVPGIIAEAVSIDKVMQGEPSGYAVIFDRISQDVPFYRAYLKNAALCGTTVINNPFWWSADEKFFNILCFCIIFIFWILSEEFFFEPPYSKYGFSPQTTNGTLNFIARLGIKLYMHK